MDRPDSHGKKPFYRSRLFWLGVPPLVFLVWCWVVSFDFSKAFGMGGRGYGFSFISRDGAIQPHAGLGFPQEFWFERHSEPLGSGGGTWFPPAIRLAKASEDPFDADNQPFTVAYWAVIILYLPAWLGSHLWWQRRTSRLLKLHVAPPP
jgi:hypothetical protein